MLSQKRYVLDEVHTVVRVTFRPTTSTVPHLTLPLMGGGPPQHAFMDVNPERQTPRHPRQAKRQAQGQAHALSGKPTLNTSTSDRHVLFMHCLRAMPAYRNGRGAHSAVASRSGCEGARAEKPGMSCTVLYSTVAQLT